MREIKFRAWGLHKRQMYYSDSNEKYSWSWQFFRAMEHAHDKIIFMQYSGLKDINGKEIYEGDILQSEKDEESRVVVEYVGCGFEVKRLHPDYEHNEDMVSFLEWSKAKIIGNINSNPYLLDFKKVKQDV